MMNKPKFKVGDIVRIPHVTPGHDRHKSTDTFMIKRVFPGRDPATFPNSYKLEGSPSNWPESRLKGI
mgnify:CR=1 FL=1